MTTPDVQAVVDRLTEQRDYARQLNREKARSIRQLRAQLAEVTAQRDEALGALRIATADLRRAAAAEAMG